MKRLLLIFLFFFLSLAAFSATSKEEKTFDFTLVLEKTGTDSLWLNMESTAQTIQTATRVTGYSFPLIQASSSSDKAPELLLYLHWEKNSNDTIEIRLSFVGSEDDDTSTSGFMMNENGGAGGLNYDVTVTASYVTSSNPDTSKDESLASYTFNTAEGRLTKTTNRLVKFKPVSTENGVTTTYISPAKISIKVNPASNVGDDYSANWSMDKQYVGYIKAEMWSV